ncbi:uncharacterized protein LOC110697227 [Chenopodium quinoa]|uniref:uncharacterized protein LOC110697227 n=1 Tax=Chenopodium quinoa TaxID=63459 RepID=UPI000B794B15|nr:uncharacterized protein LOC110697227 [Chenopodium quinoa]
MMRMPGTTRARGVTHADLAPKPQGLQLSSKTGALLTILCILCGLLCFILSLFAEATRSEVSWMLINNNNNGATKGHKEKGDYECMYSGSGKVPLICASVAFVALAIAMLIQHSFLLIAISKTTPPVYVSWDPQSSIPMRSLTWQAGFFFISTWLCFAVGEIMLLIGLSVESGHLKDWSTPKTSCLIIREGVFTAAGVFSLLSVFLAAGLYATALRVQWLGQQQETIRREILEASSTYASPPRSPQHSRVARDAPTDVVRQDQTSTLSQQQQQHQLVLNNKQGSLV